MWTELFNLKGRRALVTGASRGIGRAIALALAECGAEVAVHYAGNESAAQETAATAAALGVRTCIVPGDLADPASAQKIAEQAARELGPVDILVLNASIQHRIGWEQLPLEIAMQQLQVNFLATLQLIQQFAPGMLQRNWGRIVTLGSVQQMVPSPQMPVYAATKSAQLNLVRNLARDFAPAGVTVNNLAPGVIATDRAADVLADPAWRQRVLERIRVGFFGEPRDCVGAALLLCSDAGRYITGADLIVDGGWSLM